MEKIIVKDNKLQISNTSIDFEFPIKQIITIGEMVIVLLNPDSNLNKFGQFQNLFGVSLKGKILWKCNLPTSCTGDCYYQIKQTTHHKITAYSVASYICEIDPPTGKIISKIFTK